MLGFPIWGNRRGGGKTGVAKRLLCELFLYLSYMWKNRLKLKAVDNWFCFGCEKVFNRKRGLIKHQGAYWPGCPEMKV